MLKHIVFFTFKDTNHGTAQANAERARTMLTALPRRIPEIKALEVGRNIAEGPAAAHLALTTAFEDEAALERYRVHPEHQEVVDFIMATTNERRFVDYWD